MIPSLIHWQAQLIKLVVMQTQMQNICFLSRCCSYSRTFTAEIGNNTETAGVIVCLYQSKPLVLCNKSLHVMGDFYVTYTLSPSLTHPFLAPLILCPYRTVVHPNFLLICSQFPLTDPPLSLSPSSPPLSGGPWAWRFGGLDNQACLMVHSPLILQGGKLQKKKHQHPRGMQTHTHMHSRGLPLFTVRNDDTHAHTQTSVLLPIHVHVHTQIVRFSFN